MRILSIIHILTLVSFLHSVSAATYTRTFDNAADWDECLYDWKIDVTTIPDEVSLLKTELISDEMGTTTQNMGEQILGQTWIKKEFLLDKIEADKAVLLIHCNSHGTEWLKNKDLYVQVLINNNPIKLFIDTERMLSGGWVRCDIPVEYLKPGINTCIFYSDTAYPFKVSVEASRIPNRSAKSMDGGKTWDYDHLGINDYIDGEYLMRLRLSRYPASAEIMSDYIELASFATEDFIKPEIAVNAISVDTEKSLPAGTDITFQVRGGESPAYNPADWSPWLTLRELESTPVKTWKFMQWRAELATNNRRVTPLLKNVTVTADIDVINSPSANLKIVEINNASVIRGYYQFAHQEYELERLHLLKQYYRLDEVTAECAGQFQAIRSLAFWMRGAWRDGWHTEYTKILHTPWDAFTALEMVPRKTGSGMCTIYSTTFIQCALSLGYNARGIVLDHHYVSEVWMNDMRKWVVIDIAATTASLKSSYYEKDGIPLNSLEMHREVNAGKNDEIWIVPAGGHYDKMRSTEAEKYKMLGGIQWKPRFGMPLRNNYLTSLMPGELEHGFMQYHYDGYLWWKDSAIPKFGEYTYQSGHKRDFYWTINEVQIFPSASSEPDKLRMTFDTETPNFKSFLVNIDDGMWKESDNTVTWKLHPGENTLMVKSLNKFGLEGIESSVIIHR